MKRTLVLALATGLATSTLAASTVTASAQTAAATPAGPAVAAPPQAIPAKIAIIAFEQAVVATNEGQRSVADVQKKYEPQKAKIDALAAEVESLKKQLQALPANASDEQRAGLLKSSDSKEKQLNFDAEAAQTAYQNDLQEAYGKVAQKVGAAAVKYVTDNGFTMLLNVGGGQNAPNPVLWFVQQTDVTQAVVNAYNASSGIAAPAPSAPSASRPRPAATTPRPAATTPSTAPKK
jgi:Skp family chaperone for outer membrane proteins